MKERKKEKSVDFKWGAASYIKVLVTPISIILPRGRLTSMIFSFSNSSSTPHSLNFVEKRKKVETGLFAFGE
jgi:hypothetical protein